MLSEKNQNRVPVITKLQYQFPHNIASFVIGSTNQHRVITFSGVEVWKDLYFTPNSANIAQPSKRLAAGKIFNQALSFSSPGEDPTSDAEIAKIEELEAVVRIEYNDGRVKIIGSDKNPARLNTNFKSDNDATKSTFAFECDAIAKAYYLE